MVGTNRLVTIVLGFWSLLVEQMQLEMQLILGKRCYSFQCFLFLHVGPFWGIPTKEMTGLANTSLHHYFVFTRSFAISFPLFCL